MSGLVSNDPSEKFVFKMVSFYESINLEKERCGTKTISNGKDWCIRRKSIASSKKLDVESPSKVNDSHVNLKDTTNSSSSSKGEKGASPASNSRKNSRRLFCAKEILFTEKTYVQSLLDLQYYYIQPLSKVVSAQDIHAMFGNMVSILNFSKTLLKKLEGRMKVFDASKTLLGDIFIDLVPFFSMYLDYCCNYEFGMHVVTKFRQESSSFRFILNQGYMNSGGKDIYDYCITPVQRVARYRLLLENLLNFTPADHPDHENVKRALELVSRKVSEINRKMDLLKQQQKLITLNSRFLAPPLDGMLIQPWRYLDSEFSVVLIQSTSMNFEYSNFPANLYLLNDLFILARVVEDGKLDVLTVQPLWNCYLKKCESSWFVAQSNPTAFQIVNPSGAWTVVIEDEEIKGAFKFKFEKLRNDVLTEDKKFKRSQIRLYANEEMQTWDAIERAPSYALNRVSPSVMEVEVQECTKEALKNLLHENWERLKPASTAPHRVPKKSTFSRFKEEFTKSLTPKRKKRFSLGVASLYSPKQSGSDPITSENRENDVGEMEIAMAHLSGNTTILQGIKTNS